MKNTSILRNFVVFSLILAACVAGIGIHIYRSSQEIKKTGLTVTHTQTVIIRAQEMINTLITTIAYQRNYVANGDEESKKAFENSKMTLSSKIAEMRDLTRDNPSQSSRMAEVEHLTLQLKDSLDTAVKKYDDTRIVPALNDRNDIATMRNNILRLANDILQEEYNFLFRSENEVSDTIDRYQVGMMIGAIVAAILLLIFNWYLLEAQAKVSSAEANMRDSEERLRLAIRGSNDGIFDWDFKTHDMYWSPRYKIMLGYEDHEIKGSEETFKKLLHPEDADTLWQTFNNYINGSLSEFSCVYRMIGKDGHIVWIHGRGKALFDDEGRALRFIGAHTDVSYLKEHEQQLEDERDRAERASAAKGEFLAHMSHEIRTPLTAVSGIAEIFSQSNIYTDDVHKKLVQTLKSSTENLKELITDILDFSKIESGEIELHDQQFLLGELFDQVINMMNVRATEKFLDFTFDYNDLRNTLFYGDKQRLRQIMINLIGNAIKFTERGFVKVRARVEPVLNEHMLQIDIIDSGIGISDTALPIIFEKFRQADSSVSRRYGGTGLGLPISMKLATIMGGTIKVESRVDQGSTFSILLPFKNGQENSIINFAEVMQDQKLDDRLRAVIGDKKKILLVEDYEGNIVVLSYILDSLDCHYDVARTGLEAVQAWKSGHYDLILMDIQMPEMDGLTATRTIRKMEEEQGIVRTPIIGLTAHALVADKQKCIDSGMDDYLSKPIIEADLKNAILRLIAKPAHHLV